MSRFTNPGRLVSSNIYITVFFALLAAITAQSSVRLPLIELPLYVLFWAVMLILGLSTGWVAARENRDGDSTLQNLVTIIGIGAFLYQAMYSTIDLALNTLLTWLLIALCIRLTHRRTLYFVILASFCLILYSASISKDSLFLIYILIYVMATLLTLILDYCSTSIQQSITGSLQQHKNIPVIRTGLIIGLPIILITTGLYLLVPRPAATHYGFFPAGGKNYYHDAIWQKQANSDLYQSAEDQLDPHNENSDYETSSTDENQESNDFTDNDQSFSLNDSLRPEINNPSKGESISNDIVLYMQGPRAQYLRGAIYDHFDGKSWHTLDKQVIKHRLENGKLSLKPVLQKTRLNQYTITTKKQLNSKNLIVIPPESTEIRFPGSVIAQDEYETLYAPKQIRPDTIYSVHVPARILPGRPYIEQISKPYKSSYLQLPEQLPERIINLSMQLSEGQASTFHIALAMENYLRSEYQFSYQTITSQNNVPLDEFLFETKYGHCEYFATAMAILLRARKIPARLVTGYSVTTFNPITGYYEARVLDGHAWVEAWIAGKGWVTFEPTAAYALPKQTLPPDPAHALQAYYEKLSVEANQLAPDSVEAGIYTALNRFFSQFNHLIQITWQILKSTATIAADFLINNAWWILMTGILGYIVSHYMIYRIKTVLACYRVKRLSGSNPLYLLSRCYAEMETMLSRYGSPRDPSWTLRQYRREISRTYPELKSNFKTICDAYNAIRYSSQMPNDTTAKIIKTETLEILKHRFQTPVPAKKLLEPLLIILGYSEKGNEQKTVS